MSETQEDRVPFNLTKIPSPVTNCVSVLETIPQKSSARCLVSISTKIRLVPDSQV